MTDPAALLAGCLPADPTDHGPIGVSSDALRALVALHSPPTDDEPLGPEPVVVIEWLERFTGSTKGMAARTVHALRRAGYEDVGEARLATDSDLLGRTVHFGPRCLDLWRRAFPAEPIPDGGT